MTNKIYIFIIILFSLLIFSCSGVKKTAKQETVITDKSVDTSAQVPDERKQMEFETYFIEALKQKMFNNPQKAVQLLSTCLEIDPNSSAAMFELANIHASNNDLTSASLLLEKAIGLNQQNKWYKLLLAKIYQQMKKFEDADKLFVSLIKEDPDNIEYMLTRAMLLGSANKTKEALEIYNQIEKKTGLNEQISVAKQEMLISTGNYKEAQKEIQKLIDSNPTESKYYGLLADLYREQGDEANALKYYNKILEMEPDNGFVHITMASFYFEKGDMENAYTEARKSFESNETDVQTKLQLFLMLTSVDSLNQNTGREEELIQVLLEKHPDVYLVHTIKAESLLRKGMNAEARDELLKAFEIEKNDYKIREQIFFIDNELRDWKGMTEHTKSAIELFPNQPTAYFFNAIGNLQLEKFNETISIIDEGLDYVVDNKQLKSQMLMIRGEALYKQQNYAEAFKYFDKTIELDPENETALNNYAYYLSLAGTDLDKAERMSGKVIGLYPDNPTFLDTYAWVLFKKGNYQLAKFYMETALRNDKENNPTLMEHYGDILIKLNNKDDALKYWEKAKSKGSDSKTLERKIKELKYIEE